ncbi:MAG TPA: metallophosphoesterase [Terriglobia bacterium]|nr:metallophosphoesterase [Terriglobia bacterium]
MSLTAFVEVVVIPALLLLLVVASQVFWIRRVRGVIRKFITGVAARQRVEAVALAAYALVWLYSVVPIHWLGHHTATAMTAADLLIDAPYNLWLFGSVVGFLLIIILRLPVYLVRGVLWLGRQVTKLLSRVRAALRPPDVRTAAVAAEGLANPARRRFFEQATVAVGTVPFVAAFYGLVYGRLEIETSQYRVALPRLPRGFQGFRIAQLSDIHIGPFMSAREIRHCVEMTNRLKPDLILLTGDYVIWDPSTQYAVVDALSGLRAPYGLLGSLGNHEMWARIEGSITRMFIAQGTQILRKQNATLRAGGDELNLIGVDFQTHRPMGEHHEGIVREYLEGVEPLVRRDTANILMSHNPNTFDRAAELGIDLSLAGHTHGGQVAFEFISPEISPSRLVTPYVAGWFSKPGGKLYVNRGIGTIGIPMRMGAPPEITVYELVQSA